VLRRIRFDDPVAGSAYTYTYATWAVFMAWFIGWNLGAWNTSRLPNLAVGWSGYYQMTS